MGTACVVGWPMDGCAITVMFPGCAIAIGGACIAIGCIATGCTICTMGATITGIAVVPDPTSW